MFDVRWVFGVVGLAICAGCSSGEVEVQDFDDQVLEIPSNYDEQPELATSGKQIVYVNFDGVTIRDCDNYCSDARSDRSWAIGAHFGGSSKTFARYAGSSSQRDSIMSDLREGFDDYNIDFTTSRPSSGPYTMLIISTSSGPNHGVAPLNCGNTNANDIAFVYKIGNSSTSWIAQAGAHELGHSFGLSHVKESRDFMQWASSGDVFSRATWDSARSNKRCFDGNTQDAPAILKANLGSREPDPPQYDGTFADDDGGPHEENIERLVEAGITVGCKGGDAPEFCPAKVVTRAQMVVFLQRALQHPPSDGDYYDDDEGAWYEAALNRLATQGFTANCGARKFCGPEPLLRSDMAVFMTQALDLPPASTDYFDDDNGSATEDENNRLAEAGITLGCREREYCPDESVTRGQMASFLVRAFDL